MKQKIILCGKGSSGEILIKRLEQQWDILILDAADEESHVYKSEYKKLNYSKGSPLHPETWLSIIDYQTILVIFDYYESSKTLASLESLRKNFPNIDVNVINYAGDKSRFYNMRKVNVIDIGAKILNEILLTLGGSVRHASSVGLGRGEIVEVEIKEHSALTGRKIGGLVGKNWNIAAIYRENSLIIPSAEEILKTGDKVVVVADINNINAIVSALTSGKPIFPLQYGNNIATVLGENCGNVVKEALLWKQFSHQHDFCIHPWAKKMAGDISEITSLLENFKTCSEIEDMEDMINDKDAGLFIIPSEDINLKKILYAFYEKAKSPFVISRAVKKYEVINVFINCSEPEYLIGLGVDIAQMFSADLNILYAVGGSKTSDTDDFKAREGGMRSFVQYFKTSRNIQINVIKSDSKPVSAVIDFMKGKENELLVISHGQACGCLCTDPSESIKSVLKVSSSVLIIPA